MFWSVPSCSMIKSYKEKCSKLNQAVKQIKSVKVVTKNNITMQFKSVGIQSGTFFGLEHIKGKFNKIVLNINDIKMVTVF